VGRTPIDNFPEKFMEVKNHLDLITRECHCTTWLNHWKRSQPQKEHPNCSVYNCTKMAHAGGHVTLCDEPNSQVYIIPMCLHHNATFGRSLKIKKNTTLVSWKYQDTCQDKV
jgi:hypothetical protein